MFTSAVTNPGHTNETFGFPKIADSVVGSAPMLSIWKFQGTDPLLNLPANKTTDTHELPRQQQDAQDMMNHFFSTGEILNFCNGSCVGIN
jgi:hypothetical protein